MWNCAKKILVPKIEIFLFLDAVSEKFLSKRIEIIEKDHLAKGDGKNFHAGKEISYWTGLKTGYANALDIVERELEMKW